MILKTYNLIKLLIKQKQFFRYRMGYGESYGWPDLNGSGQGFGFGRFINGTSFEKVKKKPTKKQFKKAGATIL